MKTATFLETLTFFSLKDNTFWAAQHCGFPLWLGGEEDTLLDSCCRGAAWKWRVKVLGKQHHQFHGLLGSFIALSSSTLPQLPQGPLERWEKLLVHVSLQLSQTVCEGRQQRAELSSKKAVGKDLCGALVCHLEGFAQSAPVLLGPQWLPRLSLGMTVALLNLQD